MKKKDYVKISITIVNNLKLGLNCRMKFVLHENIELLLKNHFSNEISFEIEANNFKVVEGLMRVKKLHYEPLFFKIFTKTENS